MELTDEQADFLRKELTNWKNKTLTDLYESVIELDAFNKLPKDIQAKIILATDEPEWVLIPKRLLEN